MIYIKRYNEDIDWDNFDFEEEESPPLKVGDGVLINGKIEMWNRNRFYEMNRNGVYRIEFIDKSKNITGDIYYEYEKGTIPYDGWLVIFDGHWPWFKYDENVMKKV